MTSFAIALSALFAAYLLASVPFAVVTSRAPLAANAVRAPA